MKIGEIWEHNSSLKDGMGMLVKLIKYNQEKDGYSCAVKPCVRDENTEWEIPTDRNNKGVFILKRTILKFYHLYEG